MRFELGKPYTAKKTSGGILINESYYFVSEINYDLYFVNAPYTASSSVFILSEDWANVVFGVEEEKDARYFLLKAAQLQEERGKEYDTDKERSMGKTVTAFNTITGHNLSESEGWLLLQLLKDVRQWTKKDYHADSAEDCIAYAALKAEALCNGK